MECSDFFHLWRRWIRFVVVVVYIILLVIAVPLCIWELERNGAPDHVQAWFIGGMFVLMALPISFWGILQHIINYTTPHLQRYIIRILWMVPIYALNAWFALRFPAAAIYLDTLRECYEAYVIYNFMAYLLSFLNHEYPHLEIWIENKPHVKHIFPLCLLPPCPYSAKFIQHCKHGVLQYTVIRPTMTIIALICEMFDKYGEGDFNFTTAWSYIVIINNLSQIFAMYCLVFFYKAFREELKPLKPISQFLCVKAVVFLSFWQALVIAALAKKGVIPEHGTWVYKDIKAVSNGIQDFAICIEMFVAAIAHYFSFSYKPFVNMAAEQQNCCASFLSMWNVRDVTEDVVEHARYIGRGMHKTLSRGKRLVKGGSSERTPLLAGTGNEASQHLSTHTSFQNSQDETEVKSGNLDGDTVSSFGDSLYGHRYDTFVNKSTTSSMNNYADFRSESSLQQESKQELSTSVSLKGFDSSGDELDRDNGEIKKSSVPLTQFEVAAEIAVDVLSANAFGNEIIHRSDVFYDDDTFQHLDIQENETIHHLDDFKDEISHYSDGLTDETPHYSNVPTDETPQHSNIHSDEQFYHLYFHGDKIANFLDDHNSEQVHNIDTHKEDISHYTEVDEHYQSSEPIFPHSTDLRIPSPETISDIQDGDIQDGPSEHLSADNTESSKNYHREHEVREEITINKSQENVLHMREHNSENPHMASEDSVSDKS